MVTAPGMDDLVLPLDQQPTREVKGQVCADTVTVLAYPSEVSDWFSQVLGTNVHLVRMGKGDKSTRKTVQPSQPGVAPARALDGDGGGATVTPGGGSNASGDGAGAAPPLTCKLSFTNEGQYLLVSECSVADVVSRVRDSMESDRERDYLRARPQSMPDITASTFRPNIVVDGAGLQPYAEDSWGEMSVVRAGAGGGGGGGSSSRCSPESGSQPPAGQDSGGQQEVIHFRNTSKCTRCTMVNVNQATGVPHPSQPLRTLSAYRRERGRVFFGCLLAHTGGAFGDYLTVGDEILLQSNS